MLIDFSISAREPDGRLGESPLRSYLASWAVKSSCARTPITSLYSSALLKRQTGLKVLTEEWEELEEWETERLGFLFFTLFIYSFGYEDEKEVRKLVKHFTMQKLPLILVCLRMNMFDTPLDMQVIHALLHVIPATSRLCPVKALRHQTLQR